MAGRRPTAEEGEIGRDREMVRRGRKEGRKEGGRSCGSERKRGKEGGGDGMWFRPGRGRGLTWSTHNDMLPLSASASSSSSTCGRRRRRRVRLWRRTETAGTNAFRLSVGRSEEEKNELTDRLKWSSRRRRRPRSLARIAFDRIGLWAAVEIPRKNNGAFDREKMDSEAS